MTPSQEQHKKAPENSPIPSATESREVLERIRQRADLTAKTLGGLGTSAVTAVGIAKFGDVFPWPGGVEAWVALIAIVSAFITMAFVVAFFTRRLWSVSEPITMRSSIDAISLRDEEEKQLVSRVFRDMAVLNGAASLESLEARAHRLSRISEHVQHETAVKLKQDAQEIMGGIYVTYGRAAVLVNRHRASQAISGRRARIAYAGFVIAVVAFGIGADYLQSERADRIALATACAEARTAGATARELPRLCEDPEDEAPNGSDASSQRTTNIHGGALQVVGQVLPDITSTIADVARTARNVSELRRGLNDILGSVVTTAAESATRELATWGFEELKQFTRGGEANALLRDELLEQLMARVSESVNPRVALAELRRELSEVVGTIVEKILAGPQETCGGHNATVVGTLGSETLTGAPGPDVIVVTGGNDRIIGRAGDDVICGARGHDRISGGRGVDWIYGSEGIDTIRGGPGADALFAGAGADVLRGNRGTDKLDGGGGRDILRGGGGADRVLGRTGGDRAYGGRSEDTLRGGFGTDVLLGGPGRDLCHHGPGKGIKRSCQKWPPAGRE
jgi:hypothetical protein